MLTGWVWSRWLLICVMGMACYTSLWHLWIMLDGKCFYGLCFDKELWVTYEEHVATLYTHYKTVHNFLLVFVFSIPTHTTKMCTTFCYCLCLVYLRTSPEVCMQRLKLRGRQEEEPVTMVIANVVSSLHTHSHTLSHTYTRMNCWACVISTAVSFLQVTGEAKSGGD